MKCLQFLIRTYSGRLRCTVLLAQVQSNLFAQFAEGDLVFRFDWVLTISDIFGDILERFFIFVFDHKALVVQMLKRQGLLMWCGELLKAGDL